MKYVEIYELKNDGTQEVIVTCELKKNRVVCRGDENFIEHLEKEGILNYSDLSRKLFPKDGLGFLEQLKFNFKSGYLNASDIKKK